MAKHIIDGTAGEALQTRVLVVDQDPTARLTLQTVLEAGGYRVDAAATAAEAVDKMEDSEYALVLSELQLERPNAGAEVIAHARMMEYQPATAIVKTYLHQRGTSSNESNQSVLVEAEEVPELLGQVASLIGQRATRKVERLLLDRVN